MYRGIKNHYRKDMPLMEKIIKDLTYALKDGLSSLKRGARLPVIMVYPDFPSKKTTIQKIASELNYRLTNKPVKSPDICLFFENKTDKNSYSDPVLKNYEVLNLKCSDISKKRVDKIHQEVFGYCTVINPSEFQGIAVVKSDENAMHDGEEILCPISNSDPSKVYQVLIDNSVNDKSVVDLRVPIIGQSIPLIYQKFKTMELRFTNEVFRSSLHQPETYLSMDELKLIQQFATAMKVDFAELDVLRDKQSGKIYVIDVNTTPYGPPKGLTQVEDRKAVQLLTEAFQSEFLN